MTDVQPLLDARRLDEAASLALAALERREGEEMAAVAAVLRAYQDWSAALPPLHHIPPLAIRPDERAAKAFAELLALMQRQEAQLDELRATVTELG